MASHRVLRIVRLSTCQTHGVSVAGDMTYIQRMGIRGRGSLKTLGGAGHAWIGRGLSNASASPGRVQGQVWRCSIMRTKLLRRHWCRVAILTVALLPQVWWAKIVRHPGRGHRFQAGGPGRAQCFPHWAVGDTTFLQGSAAAACVEDAAVVCVDGAGQASGLGRGRRRLALVPRSAGVAP